MLITSVKSLNFQKYRITALGIVLVFNGKSRSTAFKLASTTIDLFNYMIPHISFYPSRTVIISRRVVFPQLSYFQISFTPFFIYLDKFKMTPQFNRYIVRIRRHNMLLLIQLVQKRRQGYQGHIIPSPNRYYWLYHNERRQFSQLGSSNNRIFRRLLSSFQVKYLSFKE